MPTVSTTNGLLQNTSHISCAEACRMHGCNIVAGGQAIIAECNRSIRSAQPPIALKHRPRQTCANMKGGC